MTRKKADKDEMAYLSTLTDNQAHLVLVHLLRSDPSLIHRAADIARDLLSGIDEEGITAEVCGALGVLDVHQLWDESGSTRDGYVDVSEHSYEMMEEIIEPFLEEMERYLDRGMYDDALAYSRGIIKGICVYMTEEAGEFADWAVDNDDGLTYDVIERWKAANPDPAGITELEVFRNECLKR